MWTPVTTLSSFICLHRPLHGIPILVKDIAVTLDKLETTSGSTVLLGARLSQEARFVRKLRDAGAVILGKTNMSEWGAFRTASGGLAARLLAAASHSALFVLI